MSNRQLRRVLVVDDEPFIRKTVKTILRVVGPFTFEEAEDGESALVKVNSFRPDVVFCDVGMKPMGGFEFVEKMRHLDDEELRATRIIMLTGDSTEATVRAALRLKPDGYLVKPVSPNKLSILLRTMFDLA